MGPNRSGDDAAIPLIATESGRVVVDYQDAVKQICAQAVYIGASYTCSFSFVVIAILAGHMNKDSDDNEGSDYLSATTLITSTLYPAVAIGTSSIFSVLYYILEANGAYTNPSASLAEKEKSKKEIQRLVKNICLFSLVSLPLIATLLVFFLSEQMMRSLFSQNQSDVDLAQQYLAIAAWTILPLSMRLGFEQILFPFNKQVHVMYLALATFSLGVMLAAVCCYTLDLKLQGIAIAFLIEACITAFAFGAYLNSVEDLKEFQFFNAGWYDAEDLQQIWTLMRIGAPISISISSELIAFFLVNQLAGRLGRDELAAQDLASQVFYITFVPSFALAQVAAIKTGGAMGQKDHKNAVRYARSGLLAVILVMGVGCLMPLLAYPDLMRYVVAGSVSRDVVNIARPAVRVAAVTAFFMAISNVLLQTVRCADPTSFTPTVISSVAAFLGAALSYILGFQANWGLNGVLGGYGMGITAGAFALLMLSSNKLTVSALRGYQARLGAPFQVHSDLEQGQDSAIASLADQEKQENCWGKLMLSLGLYGSPSQPVEQGKQFVAARI